MISIVHTENLTGARISGDYWDLDALNHAFYKVIGDENKYYDWKGPRERILGISLKVRQALQGEKHVDYVDNGLNKEIMKEKDIVTSDKNIYYSVEVLWPELLFTTIALNDFVQLHSKEHTHPLIDVSISCVHKFQSVVCEELEKVLSKEEIDGFMKILGSKETNVQEYAIQFVDMLNIAYINSTREQREKSLGTIALKLAVPDNDYFSFKEQVIANANKTKSDIHEIPITKKYPEEIEW